MVFAEYALGEFRYGIEKSTKRDELETWLDLIEEACVVLSPDATTARHYGRLRFAIEAAGFKVPYHDIWIGALAKQNGLEVVSRDADFDCMPGITRISW